MLDELFQVWHVVIASIGSLANLLLAYVALTKTPRATKSYATLILNFAVTDFAECFLDLFLQVRFILSPMNVTMIYVFHGLCKYTGPLSCKIGLSLILHCFPHSAWSLLLSFTYRFYILHHPQLTRKHLIFIILLVYTPSLFQATIVWTCLADRSEILPLADKFFPHYNLSQDSGILSGFVTLNKFPVIFLIAHLCIPIFPIYVVIFAMRQKIVSNLMKKASLMSKEARASHRQILKCLTIQALIPSLFVIAVLAYLVAQLGILTHPILEYTIYASILPMPTLSPFTYLVYIRPYRVFCLRLFRVKSGEVGEKSVRFEATSSVGKYTVSEK